MSAGTAPSGAPCGPWCGVASVLSPSSPSPPTHVFICYRNSRIFIWIFKQLECSSKYKELKKNHQK